MSVNKALLVLFLVAVVLLIAANFAVVGCQECVLDTRGGHGCEASIYGHLSCSPESDGSGCTVGSASCGE